MSKLYKTFQSPYSLHKPPQTIVFHTAFLSEFVVKYLKASSFFWIFQCRNSSLTKTTDSCSFLLKKYLIVVNLSNITLSLSHSIMYALTKKLESQKQASMETFLLLLTKSPNARNFCFSYCFLSLFFFLFFFFGFVFWPIETTTANFQGFIDSNPSKSTNQVTISNKDMNHLLWV